MDNNCESCGKDRHLLDKNGVAIYPGDFLYCHSSPLASGRGAEYVLILGREGEFWKTTFCRKPTTEKCVFCVSGNSSYVTPFTPRFLEKAQ